MEYGWQTHMNIFLDILEPFINTYYVYTCYHCYIFSIFSVNLKQFFFKVWVLTSLGLAFLQPYHREWLFENKGEQKQAHSSAVEEDHTPSSPKLFSYMKRELGGESYLFPHFCCTTLSIVQKQKTKLLNFILELVFLEVATACSCSSCLFWISSACCLPRKAFLIFINRACQMFANNVPFLTIKSKSLGLAAGP